MPSQTFSRKSVRAWACACFTLIGLAWQIPPALAAPESGRVSVSVGPVSVVPPGAEQAQPLNAGDVVAVGSTVRTGEGARAVIVMTARSVIRVSENSELIVETVDQAANPPKVTIDLKDGSLGAMLKPEEGGQIDFQIRTPSGIAAARGTFFAVVVEDGVGFTQVKEGRVEVIPARAEAGQDGDAEAGAAVADPSDQAPVQD